MSVVFFLHYHDDMDIQIPYFDKVVLFGSILAGLIFILKINYRWQAIAVARKAKTKFSISMSGIRNLAVYELIYVALLLMMSSLLFLYVESALYLSLVGFGFVIEAILHLGQNFLKQAYYVVVQGRSITVINTSVDVISWKQIERVETRHDDIRFIDQYGRVKKIEFSMFLKKDLDTFLRVVENHAIEKKIYSDIIENR